MTAAYTPTCQLRIAFHVGKLPAEENNDQPQELFNETGVPIEPLNLNREREEGTFDSAGGYIPSNFPQVKDAWLAGIDGAPAAYTVLHMTNHHAHILVGLCTQSRYIDPMQFMVHAHKVGTLPLCSKLLNDSELGIDTVQTGLLDWLSFDISK